MKMHKNLLLIFSISLLLLNSCDRSLGNSDSKPANKRWLQSLACKFPCWQRIVPQETNFKDVAPILEASGIKIDNATEDEISFLFDATIAGSVTRAFDGTADSIVLNIPYEGIRLSDMEQVIGLPERLSLTRAPNTRACRVALLYPNYGTILDVYLDNLSKSKKQLDCQVNIQSEDLVERIILIDADFDNSEFWRQSYSNLKYTEWVGYSEYSEIQ